jgi:hypothetical protein
MRFAVFHTKVFEAVVGSASFPSGADVSAALMDVLSCGRKRIARVVKWHASQNISDHAFFESLTRLCIDPRLNNAIIKLLRRAGGKCHEQFFEAGLDTRGDPTNGDHCCRLGD